VRIDRLAQGPGDEVQFALRRLAPGVHPLSVLSGYVAEPGCAGLGVMAEGQAYALDGPEPDGAGWAEGRVRVVELVARDGTRVSTVRARHGPLLVDRAGPVGPDDGEITLALCRALGVPLVGGCSVATPTPVPSPSSTTATGGEMR
jgi:hypothetical protein